jgi:repressor LexA
MILYVEPLLCRELGIGCNDPDPRTQLPNMRRELGNHPAICIQCFSMILVVKRVDLNPTFGVECIFLAKRTNVFYNGTMKLTNRKKEILQCFGKFQSRKGFPPSVREIGEALDLASAGSLHKHLQALEKGGYLERIPGKKRTWNLTQKAWDLIGRPLFPSIPLIGQIAAGTPILAEENKEEDLPVDPTLFGQEEAFALRVKGNSMIDAHIRDGDLAIIRPQEDAEDGQIVAVQVEDLEPEATLKVLRKRNGTIELHPANPRYKPLIFKGREKSRVRILGRLIGVIRPKA